MPSRHAYGYEGPERAQLTALGHEIKAWRAPWDHDWRVARNRLAMILARDNGARLVGRVVLTTLPRPTDRGHLLIADLYRLLQQPDTGRDCSCFWRPDHQEFSILWSRFENVAEPWRSIAQRHRVSTEIRISDDVEVERRAATRLPDLDAASDQELHAALYTRADWLRGLDAFAWDDAMLWAGVETSAERVLAKLKPDTLAHFQAQRELCASLETYEREAVEHYNCRCAVSAPVEHEDADGVEEPAA